MATQRMIELDVLRGFAVAVMVLVVSPGAWEFTYGPLQHANWHGWSFADLVFPDFLFGVGMALGLTYGRAADPANAKHAFWIKAVRRAVLLTVLGLALNSLSIVAIHLGAPTIRPDETPSLRIPGILQRIALCYLLAVGIITVSARRAANGQVSANPFAIGAAIAFLLVGYWALMRFVPVPGFGAGNLDQIGNLAAYIDRAVFTPAHMWNIGSVEWAGPVVYDPEGLLSTLPATANLLFGVIAAGIWRSEHRARIASLAVVGIILVSAGLALDGVFPINKKIWTSSFALLTSGISFLALLLAAAMLRGGPAKFLAAPFKVLGGNAILAFSLSMLLSALAQIPMTSGEGPKTLQAIGMQTALTVINDPYLASFSCAVAVQIFILLAIWPLHRKGIYLRL